jgi:diaminopimelate epimerase
MPVEPAPASPGDVLEKWHGAGNDFLVALRRSGGPRLDAATARRWCDRHTGVGADGLLEGTLGHAGLCMALHNADGSPAEVSGNGLRCLAASATLHGLVPEGTVEVETGAGPRRVTTALDPSGSRAWGEVEMGDVEVREGGSLATGVIALVGNPHVVVADEGGDEAELLARARTLAAGLGDGANVEFVTIEGSERLSIRVVERGAGLTLACGTGSCAVAAVAHRLGLTGPRVTVANPGGDLVVTLDGTAATLSGPAVRIATIELAEPW